MRDKLDNKEIQNKQVDEPTNNFDNKENLEEYKKIQDKIAQQKDEQKEEAKYLTWLLGNDNIGEILSKYLKLDSDTIAFIENPNKPKDISKNLQFLNNQNYINKTNEEYLELFKKAQDEFKRASILRIIRKITKAVNKKDLKQIISIKKDFDNMNIKDFKKMTNILKKYEKWEFIDLPNWLSYELCTKEGEKKNKKNIPNEIRLWDDEYFIKTHVTKKDADYKQYVNSLLEIRKLFQNKWINLKYVKRSTWLVNKEFIKAYEQEFLIPKYWNKYKKIQSIKVLEDTSPAEIFYKVDKNSNPYDEKNEKKNPLRFIKEKKGLLWYVTQDDEHLKSFNEAEMWLDIDKLTHKKQEQSNLSDNENDNNNSETQIEKKLSNDEKKIYEIEHNKLPKAWFFGRIKLKVQRFFLKLKQFFKKK